MGDELIEIETSAVLRREEAAARLRELADQLSRHNQIEFTRGGLHFSLDVPDEVKLDVEIEVGDESEIEISISW